MGELISFRARIFNRMNQTESDVLKGGMIDGIQKAKGSIQERTFLNSQILTDYLRNILSENQLNYIVHNNLRELINVCVRTL